MSFSRVDHVFKRTLIAMAIATLAACGGGGSDSATQPSAATPSPAPSPAPSPSPTPSPSPAPTPAPVPTLAAPPIDASSEATLGTVFWADGNTASGGHGETIDGISCFTSEAYHEHPHLAIFRNGEMLAIPAEIGKTDACPAGWYDLHTHDRSGIIHVEASAYRRLTLGQFFSVWGQPLSYTNVAGITGLPVAIYINDGNQVQQYTGDPRDIELAPRRSITIVIGSPVSSIPSYSWPPGF